MGGSGPSSTTVANNAPWSGVQPYLSDVFAQGQQLQRSGAGSQVWSGPTLAGQSADTQNALNMTRNTASAMAPYASMPLNVANSIASNNGLSYAMSPGLSTLGGIGSGANGITTGDQFQQVANGAGGPTASESYLTSMAAGTGGTNPFLQQMLDANASRISNSVNSAMSGAGRYGSFGHADALTRTINETNLPLLSSAYESDQGRRLAAAGQIDSSRNAAAGTQLAALQGLTGTQSQNIANQMGATNAQLGFLGQGMDRSLQAAGMAPALNELAYDPATRMAAVGAIGDQRAQQELDATRALWEQKQQMPWQQLGKYSAALSGLSGLVPNTGNSTTTTSGGSSGAMPFVGAGLSLLGLLSDVRTKKDIIDLDGAIDARTGAPVKAWRYKWEDDGDPLKVGPMAQDVQQTRPELVGNVGGLLYIRD